MKKLMLHCAFLGGIAFLPVRPKDVPSIPGRPSFLNHPELTISHNQFAFHLLNAVLQEDSGNSNKLISPISVYLTLAMLYNGAGHATRDSIAEALQASEIGVSNLNSLCKELLQQIPLEDDKVVFSMANSIWYNRKRLSLLPSFENVSGNFYYAPVQALNFNGREAAAEINHWADQNTNHKIPAVIDRTSPADLVYLINAIYFKSNWRRAFHVEDSYADSFYTVGHAAKTVPFMKKAFVTKAFSDTAFTMVELPCGNGGNFSMYVILPDNQQLSIREFAASFSTNQLSDALAKMTDQDLVFSLPRWSYDYSVADLKPALCRMGMGNAFNNYEDADFSNLCTYGSRNVYISKAIHKTCIAVNENGLEAAAATPTVIGYGTPSRRISPHPLVISADHPFMYLLLEKQQQIVLFTGILNDPSSKSGGETGGLKRLAAGLRR